MGKYFSIRTEERLDGRRDSIPCVAEDDSMIRLIHVKISSGTLV